LSRENLFVLTARKWSTKKRNKKNKQMPAARHCSYHKRLYNISSQIGDQVYNVDQTWTKIANEKKYINAISFLAVNRETNNDFQYFRRFSFMWPLFLASPRSPDTSERFNWKYFFLKIRLETK